ncbi:hypothetical protein NPIL_203791 [Nephila pilipes]|uniref:Uncharacterized protein n=1 Tax=Nephila pilipes TaxID=299642 RepID=A0A8X6PEG5_NEPPI|nr:hypothetical protein NPIL_203791 [Nephila pilipes]
MSVSFQTNLAIAYGNCQQYLNDATVIYTNSNRDDQSLLGIGICLRIASNHNVKIKKRNADLYFVFRSKLNAVEEDFMTSSTLKAKAV